MKGRAGGCLNQITTPLMIGISSYSPLGKWKRERWKRAGKIGGKSFDIPVLKLLCSLFSLFLGLKGGKSTFADAEGEKMGMDRTVESNSLSTVVKALHLMRE